MSSTYSARRSKGLCVDCANPTGTGLSRCESCLPSYNESCKRKRDKVKAKGKCITCYKKNTRRGYHCDNCKNKQLESQKQRNELRKKEGLCRYCPLPRLEHSESCLACWIRAKAIYHFNNEDHGLVLLERLEEQKYICYLCKTGPLIPGFNCSLEHIYPNRPEYQQCRGVEFVLWAHTVCNEAKGPRTPEEFFEHSRLIAANNPVSA